MRSIPQRHAAREWPHLDLAAKLVVENHHTWEGRYYDLLAPAAQALEHEHPLAATVLYRSLLDDILARARSKAYGHGGRYLSRLDALAVAADEGCRQAGIDTHATYRAALQKAHARKSGFWSGVTKA